MRLTAADYGMFVHLIGLLNEAGLDGHPVGGNELVVPDGTVIEDDELRAEINRTLLPGTTGFAAGPLAGSDAEPSSASGAAGVVGAQTQTGHPEAIPPAAPMPVKAPRIMGPTGMQRPPRAGPGSSQVEQRRYATQLGIDVPAKAGRDQIIAIIDEHEASDEDEGSTTGGPQ